MSITRTCDFLGFHGMVILKLKHQRRRTLFHFLFLTISMCWLMLFVFYAPDMGLMRTDENPFGAQNLFLAVYVLVVFVCMFIPRLYSLRCYRLVTLIGAAGALVTCALLFFLQGVLRWVGLGVLGVFCGLFTFSGIVFVLMKQLRFKWQMAAVGYIIGINPLISILIELNVLSFTSLGYWLLCFGLLALMVWMAWFGFIKPEGDQPQTADAHALDRPHRTSLRHTRRMLWLGYAIVCIITLILTFAIFITQKSLGEGRGFIYFYLGQMTAGVFSFGLAFTHRAKLPLIYYSFLGVAFVGFILILLVEVAPAVQPWAVFALGCAELGSVLEWILIPRVCSLWERAHVFEKGEPERNWNLRALRGFFLFYALGMLAATLLSEWLYGLGAPFFFVLSLASLVVLFIGNLILAGFTRYRFFPAVGPLPVEGPVENDALRRLRTLSEREQQVLGYIMQGYTLPQVAEKLFISLNTVKTHGSSIYRKLGVNTRQELFLRYLDVGEQRGAPPRGSAAP